MPSEEEKGPKLGLTQEEWDKQVEAESWGFGTKEQQRKLAIESMKDRGFYITNAPGKGVQDITGKYIDEAGGGGVQGPTAESSLDQIIAYYGGGGDQYAADIKAGVMGDIRGPGYQQASFGTAGTGLPGAPGRIQKGQATVDRKAAAESAKLRRAASMDAAKIGLMANQQKIAEGQLSLAEAQLLGEQYVGLISYLTNAELFDEYAHMLPGAMEVQYAVYQETGDARLAMQAAYEYVGIGTKDYSA